MPTRMRTGASDWPKSNAWPKRAMWTCCRAMNPTSVAKDMCHTAGSFPAKTSSWRPKKGFASTVGGFLGATIRATGPPPPALSTPSSCANSSTPYPSPSPRQRSWFSIMPAFTPPKLSRRNARSGKNETCISFFCPRIRRNSTSPKLSGVI